MKLSFCALCGDKNNLEHHHVLPKILGGTDEPENILTLCSLHHCKIHSFADSRINAALLIREGKKKKKELGLFAGGRAPFGYRVKDNVLVEHKREQHILSKLVVLDKIGISYYTISDYLKQKYGIDKSHMGVKRILNEAKKSQDEREYTQRPRKPFFTRQEMSMMKKVGFDPLFMCGGEDTSK